MKSIQFSNWIKSLFTFLQHPYSYIGPFFNVYLVLINSPFFSVLQDQLWSAVNSLYVLGRVLICDYEDISWISCRFKSLWSWNYQKVHIVLIACSSVLPFLLFSFTFVVYKNVIFLVDCYIKILQFCTFVLFRWC